MERGFIRTGFDGIVDHFTAVQMGSSPLVSVIMIFFNAERFVSEAIRSVFAQSCQNWELLLVDDGSTDRSTQIALQQAERYPDRVRFLQHEGRRNLGMSASRNAGIRASQGDYIAFLDADDVWLPHKLERQVAELESHPEAVMVYGPSQYWFSWTGLPEDSQRDFVPPVGVEPDTLVNPPSLMTICHPLGRTPAPATCGLMLRRQALEQIGGFEESFRGLYEDQAFLVKIFLKGAVFVSGECVARYRMHQDSCVFVSLRSGRHDAARAAFLRWLRGYLKRVGVKDDAIWSAFRRAYGSHRFPAIRTISRSLKQLARRLPLPQKVNLKRRPERSRVGLITAHPNPIRESGPFADRFLVGVTTLSWTPETASEVEVRVGAPGGPLLSRTAGSGSATTGCWVHDGMTFYLQDVSGGKPLSEEHTLDSVKVRVIRVVGKPAPPVGKVRFGDFRRITPVSLKWGFDRGRPVDRYYIETFLAQHAEDVRGHVLEVGDTTYARRFGGDRVAAIDILNVQDGVPGTTIVGDLSCAPHISSDTFDCILLTQTLQLVYDPRAAVQTLCRILKPGGTLLATVPGISQTYDPCWGNRWYWNYTVLSAERLFAEVFPRSYLAVQAFGNVLAAVCFLEGLASDELAKEELNYRDPGYEVTVAIRAVKPERIE